jgi:DUF1365 family protein
MRYPPEVITDLDKFEFCYQSLEKLRQEHNAKGLDFKEGRIREADFREYQKSVFNPISMNIAYEIGVLSEIVYPKEGAETGRERAQRLIPIKANYKASTRYSPNLRTI